MPSRFGIQHYVSSDDVSDLPRDRTVPRTCLRFALLLLFLLCASSISCGGLTSSVPPPMVAVSVSPASAQPYPAGTVQFTAAVQNAASSAVNWQVNTMTGGSAAWGTISPSGLYTAPTTLPTPPTVTVTAVLQADSTKTGSSSVAIQSLSSIPHLVLSPARASVTTSQPLHMSVVTAGLSNTLMNWFVDDGLNGSATSGFINDGVYTPPATAGAHVISASLMAIPSTTGSAMVQVTDFTGTFTWRNDNYRSGVNSQERVLAPETVSPLNFGKLFSCPLNGYAYAQPLFVSNLVIPEKGAHNVVIVATEMDTVYAFDADNSSCVLLWQTPLVPAGERAIATPPGNDITPFIGITGTPVIDPTSSTLYVVATTQSTEINPVYHARWYALDLATGEKKIPPGGVEIATPSSVTPAFTARLGNQRAALLLDNAVVYIAFGSYGGQGDYHGWLFGYDSTKMQQVSIFDVTPDLTQGGIWQSGGGPSADLNHNVYVATGSGPLDVNRGGVSYSESFLRLTTAGTLAVADYFSPCNQATLFSTGQDVGSSAPLLLPDSAGSSSQPHLMIGGAKNGALYLLNRDNLGGFSTICPDQLPRAQTVAVGDSAILSTPIFWNNGTNNAMNNAIYVAAGNGTLKRFPMPGGVLATTPDPLQSPEAFGPQGATPVISANGANNGLIWVIDSSGAQITPNTAAILRVFDVNNLSNELYNSAMVPIVDTAGLAVKFTVPTVANGKVYVGTQKELDVYGLLH